MRKDGGSILGDNVAQYDASTVLDLSAFDGYLINGGPLKDNFFYINVVNRAFDTEVFSDVFMDMTVNSITTVTGNKGRIERVYTSGFSVPAVFSSSAPSIIKVETTGEYLQLADGTSTITVTDAYGQTAEKVVQPPNIHSETVTEFLHPEPGSLRAHICDNIIPKVEGLTGTLSEKLRFSVQDHLNSIYVKNAECWASSIDFSPCSPWNSAGGGGMAGTLVSPRHFIHATHYPISIGATIRFISDTGLVVNRTVNTLHPIGGTDIILGQLDDDVPDYIKFASILPTTFLDYLPAIETSPAVFLYERKIPCINLDQEEKVLISAMQYMTSDTALSWRADRPNAEYPYADLFYEDIIVGDSGNPTLFPINGRLTLLFCFLFPLAGPGITNHISEINQIMDGHTHSYQLRLENLSSFNKYPHA